MKQGSISATKIRTAVTQRILESLNEQHHTKKLCAESIMVSQRYYFDMQRGKYECGVLPLLIYLMYDCANANMWLAQLRPTVTAILEIDGEWYPVR